MKKFLGEFKEFINKGDVMSMAVGIIIGGAFTAIVNAIVENLLNPLLGMICGGIDFSTLGFKVGEAFFGIGNIINAVITFLLTALVLFWIMKGINSLKDMGKKKEEEAAEEPAPEEPSREEQLLTEIRDILNKK